MDKGETGERYIVSGENVTVKQLFDTVAELAGIPAPTWKVPVVALRSIATALRGGQLGHGLASAASTATRWTSSSAHYAYFDSGKAAARARLHVAQRPRDDSPDGGLVDRPRLRRRRAGARRSIPHPSFHGAY